MKQIISSILILSFTLVSLDTVSQPLKELVNKALEKNYQINISRRSQEIAANNNTAGNAGQLPSVDVSGVAGGSSNSTLQEFADGTTRQGSNAQSTNIGLSALASWTLFDGFRVHAKKEQLKVLESIGSENVRFYIEQTVSDLVSMYYQLSYEEALLKNYRNSMKISAFRLEVEKKRKSVGSGLGIVYQQALVDYRSDSIRLVGQENVIAELNIEINRIIGENLEGEITLTDTGMTLLPMPGKDSLLASLERNNSALQMQNMQELLAESVVRMERADRYPKISLYAGYEYNETTSQVGFFKSNRNYGPTVGVRVSFNLYNGGNTNREVRNALLSYDHAELSREAIDNDLRAELLKLYLRHTTVTQQLQAANENVTGMKKIYHIAADQLKAGAINGYDFRLTQLSLLQNELTALQLRFMLKSIEINLNRLSGTVVKNYL